MSAPADTAPVEAIRRHFPALERVQDGVPVAYFDGPGGTQVPRRVADAVRDYLLHHNANTHWAYPTSEETDALLQAAREALADFLNGRPDEIAFGANMTTLTYHLGRALGRGWQAGDEVVITELDHHANVAPWQALARERGVVLRVLPLRVADGTLDLGALPALLGPRTRLLAIGAASNALGTITDVAAACALARGAGALTFVDAVHAAPHVLPDVQAIGCDYLACSAYKFYGPHVGVLWGRKPLLEALDVPKLVPAPDQAPERLETGTQNHEGVVGAAAAVDFLASLGQGATRRARLHDAYAGLHRRGGDLFRRLWEALAELPGVRCHGPGPDAPRTPTLALTVAGHDAESVARHLARAGVYASHGDFYALTVLERLGLAGEGVLRIGCACYTTREEVERVVAALRELVVRH